MTSPARDTLAVLPERADLTEFLPSGRSLLVGLLVLAAAAASYAVARVTPMFAVARIEIRGTDPRGRAEVRRALRGLRGESLLGVSAGAVERRVAALPDIAGATYDRDFPHTLRVFVVPEQPVAVLRDGAQAWLVSARGRVLREVPRGTLRKLPRAWGGGSTRIAPGDSVGGRAAAIVAALAELRRLPLPSGVRGATLDDRHGLVLVLRSGLDVRLGAPTDVDLKLAIARRIIPLAPRTTTLVDVSVPERPVSSESQPGG